MVSDARAQQAREHHRAAQGHETQAARNRAARNALIHALRADPSGAWTYAKIARAVGISEQLVSAILNGRVGKQ